MKKVTKIEMFTEIMKDLTNPDHIAFIEHEIELLENKKNGVKKPTPRQELNAELKENVKQFLSSNGPKAYCIADIKDSVPRLKDSTNQHISALMKQLVDRGEVMKMYEKRKPYFYVGE